MSCPTCDHTLQRVNEGANPKCFYCPRCGTLKNEGRIPEFTEPSVLTRARVLCDMIDDDVFNLRQPADNVRECLEPPPREPGEKASMSTEPKCMEHAQGVIKSLGKGQFQIGELGRALKAIVQSMDAASEPPEPQATGRTRIAVESLDKCAYQVQQLGKALNDLRESLDSQTPEPELADPDADLPTLSSLKGILKGCLPPGMDSVEFIRCLRDHKDPYAKPTQGVITKLQEALPDPCKLRLLADWFDAEQAEDRWGGVDGLVEVQADLRRWADAAEAAKGAEPDAPLEAGRDAVE